MVVSTYINPLMIACAKRVTLAVVLFLAAAAPALADVSEGYDALDRGDYATALRIFEDLAAANDAEAIYALGWMHADGVGMPQDERAAAALFARGADLGLAEAQNALGYAYDFGLGLPVDPATAERWYERAAGQGLLIAKNNLAYSWSKENRNLEAALGLMSEVLAGEPERSTYLDTLGWIYFQLGRYGEAVPALCRAAEIEPGSPEVALHLGDALWRSGHAPEARQSWQRALDLQAKPADLSRSGTHYLGIQDAPTWRAMLEARIATGIPGVTEPNPLPAACAVPTS
jgi:TPR repeat protein